MGRRKLPAHQRRATRSTLSCDAEHCGATPPRREGAHGDPGLRAPPAAEFREVAWQLRALLAELMPRSGTGNRGRKKEKQCSKPTSN